MALNVALGLAASGVGSHLIAAVGHDPAGRDLLRSAAEQGVDTTGVVIKSDTPTDTYLAIEDADGALFGAVADSGLPERASDQIVAQAVEAMPDFTTVFLDANLQGPALRRIAEAARQAGCEIAVNPVSCAKAPRLIPLVSGVSHPFVTANLAEASVILEKPVSGTEEAAAKLVAHGAKSALVTDGAHPAALADKSGVWAAAPLETVGGRVTGAGDAAIAAFLACSERDTAPAEALATAMGAARDRMLSEDRS